TSRCALAQGAMGNSYACHAEIEKAHNLLDHPKTLANKPPQVSWLSSEMVETHSSEALLALAQKSSRDTHLLVAEAEKFLTPHMENTSGFRHNFPRDILLRGSYLASGYVRSGELDQGVTIGKTLLNLAPSVRSQRVTTVLRRLSSELNCHRSAQRTPYVAEFSESLQRSLAATAI
ncbi:MAG: hypothetical protein ACRDPW_03080, partial [Mycobacteriales bacterium]